MKKKICILILFTIVSISIFAQNGPIASGGWEWSKNVTLNGRTFLFWEVALSYREQSGAAIVQNRRLDYWLYDTVSYHSGNAEYIYNQYIPRWVERLGYVIDYDNIKVYNPNTELASSVKALMQQRSCDVSVALVTDGRPHYVVINEHFKSKGTYKTTIYYLYK